MLKSLLDQKLETVSSQVLHTCMGTLSVPTRETHGCVHYSMHAAFHQWDFTVVIHECFEDNTNQKIIYTEKTAQKVTKVI